MPRQTNDFAFERDDDVTAKSTIKATSPFDDINAEIEKFEESVGNSAVGVNVMNKSENSTNVMNQVSNSDASQPIVPIIVPTYKYPAYYKPPYYGYSWPYTYPYVVPYAVPQPAAATQQPAKQSTSSSLSALVTPPTAPPSPPGSGVSATTVLVGGSLILVLALVGWYAYKKSR